MADNRIDELRRRIERDPASRLFAQLAEELRKAGELAEAIQVARGGLATHPVYPSARLTLGRALLDSGEPGGARQELELALKQAPDNILASRFLALSLEQQGELRGALEQFRATLRMAPADEALAAHVRELEGRIEARQSSPEAPTGPMPRMQPPPLPASAAAVLPEPTVRLPPAGIAPVPVASPAPPRPAPPLPAAAPGAADAGGATLPAGTVRAEAVLAGGIASAAPDDSSEAEAPEEGDGTAPFSSSTLAELYLRQGLEDRAAEVYRQVLVEDPANERARAGLAALEARATPPAGPGAPAGRAAGGSRRAVLERQIAGLEAMLAAVRRQG